MSYDVDFDDAGNIIVFEDGGVRLHQIGRVRIGRAHLATARQNGWTETAPPYHYDDGTLLVWRSNEEMLSTPHKSIWNPRATQ